MKHKKICSQNFGELLIESMEEVRSHSQGKITLNSYEVSIPNEPPKYTKAKIKKYAKNS